MGEPAPAQIELFRRAFVGDDEAWRMLKTLTTPLMRAWVGTQPHLEHADVLQEAWCAFARYAPQRPNLLAGAGPGPVLGYLRRCVKTALLQLLRKERVAPAMVGYEAIPAGIDSDYAVCDDMDEIVLDRMVLAQRLRHHLRTAEERVIWSTYFEYALPPRVIAECYRDLFISTRSVNTINLRLLRRLRTDHELRELFHQHRGIAL